MTIPAARFQEFVNSCAGKIKSQINDTFGALMWIFSLASVKDTHKAYIGSSPIKRAAGARIRP